MSPMPTTITSVPFAVPIFLLLGQGESVECLEEGIIWSMAPESNILKRLEGVIEALV